MSETVTKAWSELLTARGLTSYRRLGDAAHIAHETARRVVTGREATPASIRAVADALKVDVEKVRELRGEVEQAEAMWDPPPAASLLTRDERSVLSRLIGVMTQGREAVVGDARDTAPIDPQDVVATDAVEAPEPPAPTTTRTTPGSRRQDLGE